jgi:transposase
VTTYPTHTTRGAVLARSHRQTRTGTELRVGARAKGTMRTFTSPYSPVVTMVAACAIAERLRRRARAAVKTQPG